MNRISRILHKVKFLSRQRKAIAYSNKYVINNRDIKQRTSKTDLVIEKLETAKVLAGFDPVKNFQDRRVLYEVTG